MFSSCCVVFVAQACAQVATGEGVSNLLGALDIGRSLAAIHGHACLLAPEAVGLAHGLDKVAVDGQLAEPLAARGSGSGRAQRRRRRPS